MHQDIALLKGFRQIELFEAAGTKEYEANVFAAELLIRDDELLELLNDEDKSLFGIAKELRVPAELLVFKFRVLKHKGYRVVALYNVNGDFLRNHIDYFISNEGHPTNNEA